MVVYLPCYGAYIANQAPANGIDAVDLRPHALLGFFE